MRNLTFTEKREILKMQEWGTYRQHQGALRAFNQQKNCLETVKSFTMDNIPVFDVLFLFGGYIRPLKYAAEIMFRSMQKYGDYPEFVTVGALPNKGQRWTKHENVQFEEGMMNLGFPKKLILKNHVEANSKSTRENKSEFLEIIHRSQTLSRKPRLKVAIVTEAGYSLRAVQEFAQAMPQIEFVVFETPLPREDERILAVESFEQGYFVDLTLANVYHAQKCWETERLPLPTEKMDTAPSMERIKHYFRLGYGFYFVYDNMLEDIGYSGGLDAAREIVEKRKTQITGVNSLGEKTGDGEAWNNPELQGQLVHSLIEEINEDFLFRGIII